MKPEKRIESATKCLNQLYYLVPGDNKFQIQSVIDVLDGDLSYGQFCKLNDIELDGLHEGDPCKHCNTPHDEVEVGLCPGTGQNKTE